MRNVNWAKAGLVALLVAVLTLGYGGMCDKSGGGGDTSSGSSAPTPPSGGGGGVITGPRIVYSDNISSLKAISINGGVPVGLLSDVYLSFWVITPDYTKVVYGADYSVATGTFTLKVTSINGGTSTIIASGVSATGDFLVSPDSARVVYMTNYNPTTGQGNLMVIPINGGTPTTLSTDSSVYYRISPDSTKIVYLTGYRGSLKSVSINGGTVTTLDTDVYTYFKINADSKYVGYSTGETYYSNLKTISINGGTSYSRDYINAGWGNWDFTPDGSKVVYVYKNTSPTSYNLTAMPITTVGWTFLALGLYYEPRFVLSPDSQKVIYTDHQITFMNLKSISINGGSASLLATFSYTDTVKYNDTSNANVTQLLKISPDSTKVVYMTNLSYNDIGDLKVVSIIGGVPTNIPGYVYSPAWQIYPDSTKITYNRYDSTLILVSIGSDTAMTLINGGVQKFVIVP